MPLLRCGVGIDVGVPIVVKVNCGCALAAFCAPTPAMRGGTLPEPFCPGAPLALPGADTNVPHNPTEPRWGINLLRPMPSCRVPFADGGTNVGPDAVGGTNVGPAGDELLCPGTPFCGFRSE